MTWDGTERRYAVRRTRLFLCLVFALASGATAMIALTAIPAGFAHMLFKSISDGGLRGPYQGYNILVTTCLLLSLPLCAIGAWFLRMRISQFREWVLLRTSSLRLFGIEISAVLGSDVRLEITFGNTKRLIVRPDRIMLRYITNGKECSLVLPRMLFCKPEFSALSNDLKTRYEEQLQNTNHGSDT